ncbi:MAG: hypothetical protein JNM31_05290 [Flavobacteriales bacterium]|nr:hypothetical protein [Flavobacteriales bacterium]
MMRYPWTWMVLLSLFSSCKRTEVVPGYLTVDQVSLSVAGGQGSSSQKVTTLWMYTDDRAEGAWDLPARIPVTQVGQRTIKAVAGIRRNGVSTDRIIYPFYATWSGQVELAPTQPASVQPVFSYFTGLSFWIEAFESAGNQFDPDSQTDTTLIMVTTATGGPGDVFEGNGSGLIAVDTLRPFFRCVSSDAFTPPTGSPVFLELDYRGDMRFLIGTYFTQGGTVTRNPYLFVNPTEAPGGGPVWNKIYVDLSPVMNLPGTTERKFYIEARLPDGRNSATVRLDNVKLIHRQS